MKIKKLLFVGILLLSIGVNAQAPSPITDLLASNTAETTTDLTWTTPAGTVTEYKIFQDLVEINTTTDTFFNISGLTINTSYNFTVYAFNLTEGSTVSNTQTVLTLDVTPPSNVTNLATSNTTETSTDLSWDGASDNIAVTGYEVYQNTNAGGDVLVASPATNNTTIGSLVIGDSNDFIVYAKDAAGNSSVLPSNTVNIVTVDITPPVTIADLAASNITETTADLTWSTTDNVGVTDYEVFKDVTGVGSPASIGLTGGTTTMNVSGLILGTSYDFTVYAQDAAGNISLVSNTAVALTVDVTPPSNITNLATSNTTVIQTDLSWDVATDNVAVTGYEVYQNTNAGGDVLVASPATNSATIGNLVIGDSNDFTVYAKDAAGNSSATPSNVINVITTDTTPPSNVTNLSASNTTETSTDLAWDTATDNDAVTGYEVYQNVNAGGDVLVASPATNSVTISNLVIGDSNDFIIYAKDAAGNSSAAASNVVNVVTIDTTPPSNITNLATSNTTVTQTDLSWDVATDNVAVTGYEVYQNTNAGGDVLVASPVTNSTTIGNLVIGNSNNFTVYAKDAAGNSSAAASNVVNVITADTTPPVTIADLATNNITETTLDLTWSTTDNIGVTDYEVFQDVTGVGTPVSLGMTGGAASMNISGLILGTSYDFTVYAQDAAGNVSLVSNTATVLTVDVTVPNTVSDLTSSNITDVTASLSWTPVTDNVGVVNYEIFQDDVSIGFSGGFSSFDVEELVELTIYRFKVTAIDAAGNASPLSNVEIVETPKESGAIPYTNLNSNLISVDWKAKDLTIVGNVGIGSPPNPNYKLAVNGNVIAEEVRVALKANWPDYVFEKEYDLSPLNEVEEFINTYGHLENIPDALTAESDGISLGEMNGLLLRKIEELTLYTIQQEKKINVLSKENEQLESLNKRLLEVEKLIEQLKK